MSGDPVRYFEWDIPNDKVVEYARAGECCGCGACCMAFIAFTTQAHGFGHANPIAGWNSANGELAPCADGISIEVKVGDKRRFFNNMRIETKDQPRCSHLTADNRCSTHIGKMLLHRTWPMTPSQVTPFPECTYTFTEVGRWKISELSGVPDGVL